MPRFYDGFWSVMFWCFFIRDEEVFKVICNFDRVFSEFLPYVQSELVAGFWFSYLPLLIISHSGFDLLPDPSIY